MAYDEMLAARVRDILNERDDYGERNMFGGLCFMVGGHMCCGITSEALMLRVGNERYEHCLAQPNARPMDFTGRPLAGMIYVDTVGVNTEARLRRWVGRALDFVATLEPKTAKKKAAKKKLARKKLARKTSAKKGAPRTRR